MDLVKACSKALVVAKPKGSLGPEKKKVTVLDEEQYTEVRNLELVFIFVISPYITKQITIE